MEYVIAFKSTNFAIKAEQSLLEQKLHVTVQPVPSQIRAGCGICLRLNPDEIKQALEVLAEKNIDGISLFSKITVNGLSSYIEVEKYVSAAGQEWKL